MFGVLSISIESMKGLHINMEKDLAYGTLSPGNIQVSLSLSLTHTHSFSEWKLYSINMNVQMYKQRQTKQLLLSSPEQPTFASLRERKPFTAISNSLKINIVNYN